MFVPKSVPQVPSLEVRRMSKNFNMVISGVGGQGNILTSQIIAKAAIKAGLEVRAIGTYGAAQRGGSVISHVRIGDFVRSPFVCTGEADVIMGFEIAEARRILKYLKKGGLAIVNTAEIYPVEVIMGLEKYPLKEDLLKPIEAVADRVIAFNATEIAKNAGSVLAVNIVMLGAIAATNILPFDKIILEKVLQENIPKRFIELNMMAYKLGFEKIANLR